MRWRQLVGSFAVALITLAAGRAVLSAEIYEGAKLEAKANSIWFQDEDKLARWQELKESGNAEALAAFEEEELTNREAWQFESALSVKVLGYEADAHIVNVEMLTPGRMQGTSWFVDEGVLR
jgi:hypothetical protein